MNSVRIERLEPKDYIRLSGFADGFCPDPRKSIALVGINDRRIVSRLFLVTPAHVEGIYIEPHLRGGSLFKAMMDCMEVEAKSEGIAKLLAYAPNGSGISSYIQRRCNYKQMPLTVWSKEL